MARHSNSISHNSVNGVHRTSGNSSLGMVGHVRQVSPDRHQATVCIGNKNSVSKAIRIDPFHDDVARLWGGIKPRLLMFQLESVNRKPIRGMPKIFEKG